MEDGIFTFSNIANFSSILGLIISGFTLWYVGTIKKNQKAYEKMVLFNNVMEGHLNVLDDVNYAFKNSIIEFDMLKIRESLSGKYTMLEIILETIPDKYIKHKISCEKLMQHVELYQKGTYCRGNRTNISGNVFPENEKFYQSDLFHLCNNTKSLIDKLRAVLETRSYIL